MSIFKVLKWSQNLVKIILEYQELEKSLNEKSLNIYVSEKYVTADQLYVYPSRKPWKKVFALPIYNLPRPNINRTNNYS